MKRFNKFVATALAASMIVTGAGMLSASSEGKADEASAAVESVASQDWKNEITIGGWIQFYDTNIKSYDEQVAELAKSGMNLIDSPITTSYVTTPSAGAPYLNGTDEFWDNLERLAESLNMYYLYHGHSEADKAYEQVKDAARCIGYHLKDEPSSAQMDTLVDLCLSFKEKDPSRMAWVNLFPSYAGATNLGGTYRDYLTKWTNLYAGKYAEDYFYFDHYPFTSTESVRSSYFSDLEAVRDVAYKNGKMATGGMTQMGSWNGMERPTAAMARWNVYALLAYGMKSISHFNWVAPAYNAPSNGGEGMKDFVLTWDGKETDLYEPMSILNWQVRQLGYVLANVDVKHAYHTAAVPDGAEGLPGSFLAQPGSKGDDFVYSIAYSKDTDEPYLLVFNKALSGDAKDYTIKFDVDSGVKSLTYYKPTDYTMETLPDPTDLTTLTAPEEVNIDVSSGKATVSFLPGEMKVFKLNGADGEKVEIAEALQTPESSHASGVYAEPQKISLVTGDKGATIYYTIDGSYPSIGADSTKIYDGNLIELGEYDKTDSYCLRAVSVRGSDVSDLLELDIVIVNSSRNIAKGKTVKFYSTDLSREVGFSGFNGAASDIRLVTDGSFDPFNSVLKTDELAWAVVDLGKEVTLDKFVVSFWHDHWFASSAIKVATKEDLSDAQEVWSHLSGMQNQPNVGTTIELDEPVTARYVMVYTDHQGERQYSLYTEIQAYTACEDGEEILADTENWTSLSKGNFTNDGSTLKETSDYQTSNWNKAYSYDAKKYKNFVIDANMSINVADPGAWGFAGFMIYRDSTEAVQGQTGHGYVVGVEPKGRVLLWNGSQELGPKDANIAGWSVGSTFNIKILAYDGMISISINGKPYMTVYNSQFKNKEGYISVHSGLLPITVKDLTITELGADFSLVEKGAAVASADEVKLAVEKYVAKSDIIRQLGDTVGITDSNGKKHKVGVTWSCEDYDRTKTGNFKFVGTLDRAAVAALGLSDIHGINAYATVFVRSEVDTSVSENLLAVAASLNENEYTADSWAALQLKVEAMKDLLADKFLVQSDINVGMFQLYDALYSLVYTGDTTELSDAIAEAKAVDTTLYEEYSLSDYNKVIETAEAYLAQSLKTFAGVEEQLQLLTAAKKTLVLKTAEGTVFEGQKPELEKIPSDGSCSGSVCGSAAALGLVLTAGAAIALKTGKKKED